MTSTPILTSTDLPSIIAHNPTLAHPIIVSLIAQPEVDTYIDVLRRLPPSLSIFDLFGRLLHDKSVIRDQMTGGRTTVADLVRTDVLGWFIHECVQWLERAEMDEREGVISDDRFTKGVQNVRPSFEIVICMTDDPISSVASSTIWCNLSSSIRTQTRTQRRSSTSRFATPVLKRRTRCTGSSRQRATHDRR